MAQNIIIANATYSDVPAVDLSKVGGGTARYVDSSDADAAASDIAEGKTAYIDGVKITGTRPEGDVKFFNTFTGDDEQYEHAYIDYEQTANTINFISYRRVD